MGVAAMLATEAPCLAFCEEPAIVNLAITFFGGAILAGISAPPAAFASQPSTLGPPSMAVTGSEVPLTPQQVATGFTQLSLETQKLLVKILMSNGSATERQMTTQQIDTIYATLPQEVQRSLYAKWDALSDEQRIALKQLDPSAIKSLLGTAVLAEIGQRASDMIATAGKMAQEGASLAEQSRAYVQKLLWR